MPSDVLARRPARAALLLQALLLLGCGGETLGAGPDGPPVAAISEPGPGVTYRAGTSLGYSGGGTDAGGAAIPGSRLSWWAEFHHDTHTHPFLAPTPGSVGTLEIPDQGETSANVFYRLYLRVEDAAGRSDTAVRDILPEKGTFRVVTSPAGLQVLLDGQPRATPLQVEGVVGIRRTLGVASPQSRSGVAYAFNSWSSGKPAEHVVVTPASAEEFVANFSASGAANLPPTVALAEPAGSPVVGNPVTLAASASDSDGHVVSVSFFDGTTLIGTDGTSPFAATWTPSAAGPRTLTARATDEDGAVTTSPGVAVTVQDQGGSDTQPPTVRFLQPADSATGLGTLAVSVDATDNLGVAGVEFELDGTPVGPEDTAAPWGFSLPRAAAYTGGQHEVRARARDAAGNRSPWVKVTFTLASASDLPQGFVRELVTDGLTARVTAIAFAPDGRMFVALQNGRIEIISGGVRLGTPFVDLDVNSAGERGLIGLTLDPAFSSNGRVYVHYTTDAGGTHNRISRLTASGNISAGETVLVNLPALSSASNHNGGALAFGADGKLYVGVGDNGNTTAAQSTSSVLGKLLRFNADGTIPTDNPFYGQVSGLARAIWGLGLRNPFTFAFDPATATLFINDVGGTEWEEVNVGVRGGNYGWPGYEGPAAALGPTSPRYAYWHGNDFVPGFAIVGGAFYRPATQRFPSDYAGDYFFGDYVSGQVHRMDPARGDVVGAFARGFPELTALAVGPDGALYVGADAGSGTGVHRIRYAN
ncbi:MAG TPA: PQQ-dependent sugar dehydrogenase [Gemmatimonadales bacterium]|nr:PQQ-dependent sugar dehydrogenase [Gemmatimonadales bacterium]